MIAKVFLIIILLMFAGCTGPRKMNRVAGGHVPPQHQEPTRVRLLNPLPLDIGESEPDAVDAALSASSVPVVKILAAKCYAWCVKWWRISDGLPGATEEIIVSVEWTDSTNRRHWTLAFLSRSSRVTWHKGAEVPCLVWQRELQSAPTDAEICAFIHDTEFGYNDFRCTGWDGSRADGEVLFLGVFGQSERVLKTLRDGLSADEQRRRRDDYWRVIGEKF